MSQADLKAAMEKLSAAVQANPAMGKMTLTSRSQWKGGTLCQAKVRDTPELQVDEPADLGGSNQGMNPVELALTALGTCQEITYALSAAAMDIPLEGVRVRVRGHIDVQGLLGLDPQVPAGCGKIEFVTEIDSPADEETIRRLVETVENGCPVLDMLTRSVPVAGKASLNGQTLAELEAQPT